MSLTAFKRAYGASPLHLFALIVAFALAGYAGLEWLRTGFGAVARWFLLALIAHDLILLPLYTLLDWIAFGGRRGRVRAAHATVSAIPYIRVPALLSGLLLLVFAPEILSRGEVTYRSQSGLGEGLYLGRWLAATGIMFALSAVAYAFALRRGRRRPPAEATPVPTSLSSHEHRGVR